MCHSYYTAGSVDFVLARCVLLAALRWESRLGAYIALYSWMIRLDPMHMHRIRSVQRRASRSWGHITGCISSVEVDAAIACRSEWSETVCPTFNVSELWLARFD
jgi:hypothetical protein